MSPQRHWNPSANVPFIALCSWVSDGEKEARRECLAPSRLVHFRWPGPRATSITQSLTELTFRPAPATSRLPVLCQPLTITLVSHRLGRSENQRRESTQAEAGDGGVMLEGREEGLQGGSWGPSFQSRSGFPNERKSRVVSSVTLPQRLLKSRLSGFSSEVSSQETKRGRGKEWVGKEFNGGLVWVTGSGRMATLAFVKDWASLAAALWPCPIWGEKHHLCSSSGNKKIQKSVTIGLRVLNN